MSIDITSDQLDSAPEDIGSLHNDRVLHVETKGGFHLVVVKKSRGVEVLGHGPYRSVAVRVAQMREPRLIVSALNKSEDGILSAHELLLPRYIAETELIIKGLKGE